MQGGDGAREETQGLQLADGRQEAPGGGGGAARLDVLMQGGSEDVGMGEGGLVGMAKGKRPEMSKVRVSGAPGPGSDSGSNGVSVGVADSSGPQSIAKEAEVVRGDVRQRGA
jgi:hypothetical protein